MLLTSNRDEDRRGIAEDDPLPPFDRVRQAPPFDLDALYRDRRPQLLRFFARALPGQAAADLCQQLFLRLANIPTSALVHNTDAYLARSARNIVSDHLRAVRRRPPAHDLPIELVDPPGPDEIAVLEARDMLRRLEEALSRLTPRTREIFLAHRIDGYTYSEIADRTGLGVKAVEKHMSRAIAHLDRISARR